LAELGEDFLFTEYRRLQTGGNPIEMGDRVLTETHHGLDVVCRFAEQVFHDQTEPALRSGNHDFDAKTGGEDESLDGRGTGGETVRQVRPNRIVVLGV
jgi:hypothetical protein